MNIQYEERFKAQYLDDPKMKNILLLATYLDPRFKGNIQCDNDLKTTCYEFLQEVTQYRILKEESER